MSRWLEKQEKLVQQEAKSLGVAVETPQSRPRYRSKWKSGDFHKWRRGDSLFDLAQAMHVTLENLMAYNEIESYEELEKGLPIYYPAPAASNARKITIEVLPQSLRMHVSKNGGTKKWAFGSMTTWDDAKPSGFFPEGTNVFIRAIAKVPIDDKDDESAEAAYYLDHAALGDYENTGILHFTLGFAWSDLEEGHVESAVAKKVVDTEDTPEDAPEPVKVAQPRIPDTLLGFDADFIEKRMDDFKRDGSMHKFTESYQKLIPSIPCMAMFPEGSVGIEAEPTTGQNFMWIRDFAMKKPNRRLFEHQEVDIAATFEYDGEIYGRPEESVKNQNFFGIPMSMLQSQDDLFMYNTNIDATTRSELGGHLTWSERYIWVPINRWLSKNAPGYMKKIKQKAQKKG